jgi:glycerol kinase
MIDNYPGVKIAHTEDNLLFGTVESWVAYVGDAISPLGL